MQQIRSVIRQIPAAQHPGLSRTGTGPTSARDELVALCSVAAASDVQRVADIAHSLCAQASDVMTQLRLSDCEDVG